MKILNWFKAPVPPTREKERAEAILADFLVLIKKYKLEGQYLGSRIRIKSGGNIYLNSEEIEVEIETKVRKKL